MYLISFEDKLGIISLLKFNPYSNNNNNGSAFFHGWQEDKLLNHVLDASQDFITSRDIRITNYSPSALHQLFY
jgi:hypothetical protein